MHVGLNLVKIVPGTGGFATYVRELVPALCRAAPEIRFTAFACRQGAAVGYDLLGVDIPTVTVPFAPPEHFGWIAGEQAILPRLAQRAGCDLVHSLASTGPGVGRFRRVVTIHDLTYRVLPEEHRGMRLAAVGWLTGGCLVPLAAHRSDRVITSSRAVAVDLQRLLGLRADKVDVIPDGPGRAVRVAPQLERELRERYDLGSRPFALCVSASWPHKNLARLIEALSLVPEPGRPVLVLSGHPTRYDGELREIAKQNRVVRDVRSVGWVPSASLEGLYAAAACFVFPSLYEGFGLPVLEAMQRGVPVACSTGGALREVAGDAALLFDPYSPSAIAGAITRLLDDANENARLRLAGKQRASQFTWEATARATLDTYAKALNSAVLTPQALGKDCA